MSRILRLMASRKSLRGLRLRSFGQLPRSMHNSMAIQNTQRRQYNNSNNTEIMLNRLKNGSITKSEVQRLILQNGQSNGNNSQLNTSNSDYLHSLNSTITTHHTAYSPNSGITPISDVTPVAGVGSNGKNGSIGGTVTLGSKMNPIHMKKQTTFREFIFSLFPFLFIFWMLGGFDLMKARKQQAGVGGMFGKNYSEWDETDWEDEEDENSENNNNENKQMNKKNENEKDKETEEEEIDPKTAFFRKLGIDLKPKKDKNNENQHKTSKKTDNKNKTKNKNEIDSSNSNKNGETTENSEEQKKKKKKKQKRVRFKDVCGCDEAKLDLQDLVDYLKNPEKYQSMGCKLPKGVLMSGSPGTGKTLLARALAGEAGVPFLATNGASFDEVFVGVGVMRVRKLFERAKERAPCIVFIDEIDAIANTRMQMGTAHSSDSLNALLSEMDGFERNTGIIVIAATNMPDRLDAALVRPGRFDRKVHIQLPDKSARREIVELYLGERGDNTVDSELLVSDISGFSGAELESMVNLASIECVKQGLNKVSMKHLIEAKEIISMGRARRSMDLSQNVKKVTAYHEGGHAIVSLFTKGSKPIYKATILPRGPALGFVASSNTDEYMATKESLLAQLDVCMGGRAAEEIFNGNTNITTGASSDFSQATNIASAMVCQYGMSPKVGKVFYKSDDIPNLSPQLQNTINTEIKRLLDESYQRAQSLIKAHRNELELLAKELLEKETLSGVEIKKLIDFKESDIRQPIDFIFEKQDINNKKNIYTFNTGRFFNNNNNSNNSNSNNNNNGGNNSGGSSSNNNNNNNNNDLQTILTPETDLLNPQPSMFLKKNQTSHTSHTKNTNDTSLTHHHNIGVSIEIEN